MLDEARAIERAALAPQERLSLELFMLEQERDLARSAFTLVDPYLLTDTDGLHLRLPRLIAASPLRNEDDYRAYLARLNAVPAHVDGLIEQLQEGMRTGWTAPQASVRKVPALLRALREQGQDGALGAPLRRIPASIDADLRAELASAGAQALATRVAPALLRLEQFMRNDYLPAARTTLGASSLPGGPGYYAFLVREASGGEASPQALHELGVQEVARLRGALAASMRATGFRGTLPQFFAFARSDPRLFARDAPALLERYRRVIARASARLPALFTAALPTQSIGVKGSADSASNVAAYYEAGSSERSAALVMNTARLASLPLWEVETLALHEALPGHHLQVSYAQTLQALPAFRRHAWNDAFGEGWATYAETLGPELGLLRDPFSRFGHLNDALLRAARLVVDTGIHAFGWSRQQAIDYLNANTANTLADNVVEVDRYIAQPAQALSYATGQLRFQGLRDKAQAALGARFDLRRFHDALLGNGALPLVLLEREMAGWLAAQASEGAAPGAQGVAPAVLAPALPPAPPARP
jgi:uncharacterized protein (DUF885 family)